MLPHPPAEKAPAKCAVRFPFPQGSAPRKRPDRRSVPKPRRIVLRGHAGKPGRAGDPPRRHFACRNVRGLRAGQPAAANGPPRSRGETRQSGEPVPKTFRLSKCPRIARGAACRGEWSSAVTRGNPAERGTRPEDISPVEMTADCARGSLPRRVVLRGHAGTRA